MLLWICRENAGCPAKKCIRFAKERGRKITEKRKLSNYVTANGSHFNGFYQKRFFGCIFGE